MTGADDGLKRVAHIPGTLFRATAYYSEARQLDELARFFYIEVLPRENDLRRLRALFGLSPRLVDEVLADLIRLDYAALDVAAQRIYRIANPASHPAFIEEGSVELWYDRVTGAVMSAPGFPAAYSTWDVEEAPDRILKLEPRKDERAFEALSGGRLVSMLRETSPRLVVRRGGMELEALVGRNFLADKTLRVPIEHVRIDQVPMPFVTAPDLPALFTRSWTREIRRAQGMQSYRFDVESVSEATSKIQGDTLLEATGLKAQIDAYLQKVGSLCEHRRMSGLDDARKTYLARRDALLETIDSAAVVEFREPQAGRLSHLQELWERAHHYLMIVVDRADAATARAFVETLGRPHEWRASLIVVENAISATACADQLPTGTSPDLLQTIRCKGLPTRGLCIRDGVELRMGTLPELLGTAPLTIVEGGLIPSGVATRIASELPNGDSSAFIEDLLGAGRSVEARRQALARRDPQLVAAVDRLRRIVQDCNTVLLKTLDRASADWEKAERDELRADQDDAGGRHPIKSLRELDRAIVEMEAELSGLAARSALPAPLAACRNPVIASPGDLFDQAIRTVLVHRETRALLVAFEVGGEDLLDPQNRWWLRKVLDQGRQVTLYLIPGSVTSPAWDPASAAALDRIIAEVPHHLLKVQKGRVRLPSALVIGTSLVVIGSQAWWRAGNDNNDLIVTTDAPHLATLLWQLSEGGSAESAASQGG